MQAIFQHYLHVITFQFFDLVNIQKHKFNMRPQYLLDSLTEKEKEKKLQETKILNQ